MFENTQYRWRETYFVLCDAAQRPSLRTVGEALAALDTNYELTNLHADDAGRFESLTLLSPEDFSALDVCFTSGVEVVEQGSELAEELQCAACEPDEMAALKQIRRCNARFDVLHFERVGESAAETPETEEMLDPTALLLVLGELARLCGGVAVDPQSGSILSSEI